MKAKHLLTIALLSGAFAANAATITASASGKWDVNSTWNLGRQPQGGDSVVIGSGKEVTVDNNITPSGSSAIKIGISGTLKIESNGSKLNLPCGSMVYILTGGSINQSGNGASQSIRSCGSVIYSGTRGNIITPVTISESAPLPVTWLSFNAKRAGETSVNLKWSTASEINNSHFEIERSADAKNFTVIGKVKGNGTTSQVSNYTYSDASGVAANCYYRLRQVDLNGKSEYSIIIAVPASAKTVAKQAAGSNIVSLNPNPVVDMAELRVKGYENVNANIQVVDMSG
ncbi:MAG: G8 domain-containing protein, partial [Bacteroidia bacterium]|nr:G8 domain-containing protein [Bacteroidia bacterium]